MVMMEELVLPVEVVALTLVVEEEDQVILMDL